MRIHVVILLIFACTAISATLLDDDFEDGNADGWNQLQTGATYFVGSGWYHMIHSQPDSCTAGSYTGDQSGQMSVPDYSLLTEIYPREGVAGPMVRYNSNTGSGYWFSINPELDQISIVHLSSPSSINLLISTNFTLSYYEYYWMRLEVSGSSIGGKIWTGEPSDEPDMWSLTTQDSSISSPGSICLYMHVSNPGGTAAVHNDYDNIQVSDVITLEFEQHTWGGIKATF